MAQQRAAEKPFMQLCLQGPDTQPDTRQPPLAADLQREGERQGQLCQAGVILYGDTGKECTGSDPTPCRWMLQVKRWAQHGAQSLAGALQHRPDLGMCWNRSLGCPSAQAHSVEFPSSPALTSWLLRSTLLFTFVRLTSQVRLGRAENR